MRAYYNEIDAGAAAWLKRLIAAGKIPAGDVDERSIADVQGSDLTGYTQCHFFAGIGGWPYALQLAGWPVDREVWTGSCPCQPFSSAGKRKGTADSRHLWPQFRRLIAERMPATVFGEQVASPLGRTWLAGVRLQMEELAYEVGSADLCAASVGQKDHPVIIHARQVAKWLAGRVPIGKTLLDDFAEWLGGIIVGAPHIRQRLFWVADADSIGCGKERAAEGLHELCGERKNERLSLEIPSSCCADGISNAQYRPTGTGEQGIKGDSPEHGRDRPAIDGDADGMSDADSQRRQDRRRETEIDSASGKLDGLPDASGSECRRREESEGEQRKLFHAPDSSGTGFWSDFEIIPFQDGKHRRIEPGTFPLADGFPGRVELLKGYGNSIVPQLAAEFVKAFLEAVA